MMRMGGYITIRSGKRMWADRGFCLSIPLLIGKQKPHNLTDAAGAASPQQGKIHLPPAAAAPVGTTVVG
jgi:hypothetical protein